MHAAIIPPRRTPPRGVGPKVVGRREISPVAKALERLVWPAAVIDAQFDFVYVNAALCKLVGCEARRLVGLGARLLTGEKQERKRLAVRREVARHSVSVVLDLHPKSGPAVTVSLRMFPLAWVLGDEPEARLAYIGVACPPGLEAQRDDALIGIAWSALAATPAGKALAASGASESAGLSRREEQVNTLASFGCGTKRIGSLLGISDSTVRVLRARARRKVGVPERPVALT